MFGWFRCFHTITSLQNNFEICQEMVISAVV